MEQAETASSSSVYQRKKMPSRGGMDDDDEELIRRRNRKRKERRRINYYADDDEEGDDDFYKTQKRPEIMPRWKLFLVGGAIFLCFALLYPSVFAPMLNTFWGGGRREQQQQPMDRLVHPSMMGPTPQRDRPLPGRPPQPHPGASMRMPEQKQQQSGGGFWSGKGGSLSWMLPFYTVGVVCFLLYTLFNIMTKKKKKQRKLGRHGLGLIDSEDEEDGEETEEEEKEDGFQAYGTRGAKLSSVQKRLRKTEQAMADILAQLESISAHSKQFKRQMESATAVGEEKQQNDDDNSRNAQENEARPETEYGLSAEQTMQVEQSLRELKVLSKMCKRDQKLSRKLRQSQSTSEEEDEEEEDRTKGEDEEDEEEPDDDMGLSQTEEEEEEGGNEQEDGEWSEAEEEVDKGNEN